MEQQRMDFQDTIMKLRKLSYRAQCTFLFLYLKEIGPSMCRTAIRYACMRLDEINKEFPEGHPYRERYEKHNKEKVTGKVTGIVYQGIYRDLAVTSEPSHSDLPLGLVKEVFKADEKL